MKRRTSIHIAGFKHVNPIPNAARIGNMLMSGVIVGMDSDGSLPSDITRQCSNMFAHIRSIVEQAGGTTEDILKITVWMKDPTQRGVLNDEWLKMFPDENNRPARHTMLAAGGPALIQCDITAVIE
jgi:enamine deaminase RidA (YjgF/YER057c/UK114 family)